MSSDPIAEAILFCGGTSSRMGFPKLAADVGGKPLIRWVMDCYRVLDGVKRFYILLGHHRDLVRETISRHRHPDEEVLFIDLYPPACTLTEALMRGLAAVSGERFLVGYGDTLIDSPRGRAEHGSSWSFQAGTVQTWGHSAVTWEPFEVGLVNLGFFEFDKGIADYLARGIELNDVCRYLSRSEVSFGPALFPGRWWGVNTPEDLELVRFAQRNGELVEYTPPEPAA